MSLLKAFLPSGLAVWSLAGVGLLCLLVGGWLGNSLQSRWTAEARQQLADYRAEVARSVAAENVSVLAEMKELQRILAGVSKQLREKQAIDTAFSENLIKDLRNANGKSCELSPAVRAYVDRVRNAGTGND